MKEDDVAVLAILSAYIGIILVAVLVGLVWTGICSYLLWDTYRRVPEPYRQQQPMLAWLNMVPIANLAVPFIVHISLAKSMATYFQATGRHHHGDCGEQLSLVFGIVGIFTAVPYLNCLAYPVAIVLHIIVLARFWGLRSELPALQ